MPSEAAPPNHGLASGRGGQVARFEDCQMSGFDTALGSVASALHEEEDPPRFQSGHEDEMSGSSLHPSPSLLSRYKQRCDFSCDGVEPETGEKSDTSLAKHAIEELRMKPVPGGRVQSSDAADSDVFLVTERDIQSIIETSISRSGTGTLIKETVEAGPQSRFRPRDGSGVDLDEQSKCIHPQPSAVPDPTTMISVPKTSFAQSPYNGAQTDHPMTATEVSRRSTSEVTRVKSGSHSVDESNPDEDPDRVPSRNPDHAPFRRRSSASSRPDHLTGYCSPKHTGFSIHDHVIHHAPEIATAASPRAMPSPRSHSPHHTLQRISAPRADSVSPDLYDHGIDAHCGTSPHGHTLFTEEAMQRRLTSDQRSIPSGETWLARRSTLALPHLTPTRGCGHLIGSSPPPRRQSVPGLATERGRGRSRTASARTSLMGGFDRGEPGEWALDPNNSPAGSAGEHDSKSRSRTSSVSSVRVHWDERACSEDGRPHVCENDLDEEAAR